MASFTCHLAKTTVAVCCLTCPNWVVFGSWRDRHNVKNSPRCNIAFLALVGKSVHRMAKSQYTPFTCICSNHLVGSKIAWWYFNFSNDCCWQMTTTTHKLHNEFIMRKSHSTCWKYKSDNSHFSLKLFLTLGEISLSYVLYLLWSLTFSGHWWNLSIFSLSLNEILQ